MLLAIDIGNSAAKGGLFDGDRLVSTFRIAHDPTDAPAFLERLRGHILDAHVRHLAVSSVVPELAQAIGSAFSGDAGIPFTFVNYQSNLPIRLAYDRPSQLGTDRIAAAAAAHAFAPTRGVGDRPLVVVDAGTAVTFNVIDREGVFRGGLIWAGPDLVLRALHGGTASLPQVERSGPPQLLAADTESALYGGAILGFVEGTRGVVRRIADGLGTMPAVFVTGGRGEMLLHSLVNPMWEPHLVLHGIRIIAELNAGQGESGGD